MGSTYQQRTATTGRRRHEGIHRAMTPAAVAELERLLAQMAGDDAARVRALLDAPDQVTTAALLHDYLRDKTRADRTPRGILYLFFGLQKAIIDTLLARVVH
jgi:hypothetical protein